MINFKRSKKGFTFVEAILASTILGAVFLALMHVLSNTTAHNVQLDISTTTTLLAREVMTQSMAKDFVDVVDVTQTNFGGDFSRYDYQVDVDYVEPTDFNTVVVGPTDYKRIKVTVTAAGWPGSIVLEDMKANL